MGSQEVTVLLKELVKVPLGVKRSLYKKRSHWAQVASPFIQRIIETGTTLFLKGVPPRIRIVRHSKEQLRVLKEWTKKAMQLGYVERGPATVLSPIFAIPKPDGGFRIILDLRHPNSFARVPTFRLDSLGLISRLATIGSTAVKVDLKDAFHQVPVHPSKRKYLGFSIDGQTYRYCVLPMGAKASPYVYVKVVNTVIKLLRSKGLKLVCYVDDFLLIGRDPEETVRHLKLLLNTMAEFGWKVNWEKSHLQPSPVIDFLGFTFHLPTSENPQTRIAVPRKKKHAIAHELRRLCRLNKCTPRIASKTLGRALSLTAALPHAPVLCRQLAIQVSFRAKAGWDTPLQISQASKRDLQILADKIQQSKPRLLFPPPQIRIRSDASLSGSGAVLIQSDGVVTKSTRGTWSRQLHINLLELLAAQRALKAFKQELRGKTVLVEVDNTVAMAYLKRGTGRVKSLRQIARRIFLHCQREGIHLIAKHVKGSMNTWADHESRRSLIKLDPQVAAALEVRSVSFPIPKLAPLAEEVLIAKRVGGSILTPFWTGAAWIPFLQNQALRRTTIPVSATTLSKDSKLGMNGKLLLWDFSTDLLWKPWETPLNSF